MKFHLAHIIPRPEHHGLYGYGDVIDALCWGLKELGHDATTGINSIDTARTNIVFGGQMFTEAGLHELPSDSILYNLEPLATVPDTELKPSIRSIARRFVVWDYCPRNLEVWRRLNPCAQILHVPVGFAPVLRRIPKRNEDLDVLFYGSPSEARLTVIGRLGLMGLKTAYVCGLYGTTRDDLIARSKVVLNLSNHNSHNFETVRVSYLLANSKAVVSDLYADSSGAAAFQQAVAFAPLDQVHEMCGQLVRNDQARHELERRAAALIERQDIREILRGALATMANRPGGVIAACDTAQSSAAAPR